MRESRGGIEELASPCVTVSPIYIKFSRFNVNFTIFVFINSATYFNIVYEFISKNKSMHTYIPYVLVIFVRYLK
jgi:hypothetical protein